MGYCTEAGDAEFYLGMRWVGDGEAPVYSCVGNNPVWFIVSPKRAISIFNGMVSDGAIDPAITPEQIAYIRYKLS